MTTARDALHALWGDEKFYGYVRKRGEPSEAQARAILRHEQEGRVARRRPVKATRAEAAAMKRDRDFREAWARVQHLEEVGVVSADDRARLDEWERVAAGKRKNTTWRRK